MPDLDYVENVENAQSVDSENEQEGWLSPIEHASAG